MVTQLTGEWVAGKLPKRPENAHKGDFGKVLIFAGSENYPGAAYLAAAASYRAGAGLVTISTEQGVKIIVSRKLPEATFLTLPRALEKIEDYSVLLIGPGLGQNKDKRALIEKITGKKLPPAVFDADCLNILSKIEQWWERVKGGIILTPHPGEMAAMTGLSPDRIQKNRIKLTQRYAEKWGRIVVLKGAGTVIASPSGDILLSSFANPLLATAGTGDVLSGIIAGLLAQGLKPFDAAGIGVYIHGLAGQEVGKRLGNAGMLAGDLLSEIPLILNKLR